MKNPFEYVKQLQGVWAYKKYCFSFWKKRATISNKKPRWIMSFLLSTGGLSEHEGIIESMKNGIFWSVCWESSKRGGHYQFDIDPERFGFMLVNDYAREKNVSRQYIYQNPDKFEWVHVSDKIKFIKPTQP